MSFSRPARPSIQLLVLGFALFFLTSCATLDVAKVKQTEDVAVPIIYVDEYINIEDMGTAGLVQRLVQDEEFDLSPLVDTLHHNVYNDYAEQLPVTVMPEASVIQTDRYQTFNLVGDASTDDRYENLQSLLVPEGYKKYRIAQGALIADQQDDMFEAVPEEADGLMFASASYALVKDNPWWYFFVPFGAPDRGWVEAKVRLEMIDRSGDTILRVSETGRSSDYVTMAGGLTLSPEEIQPMCFTATEKAFSQVDTFIRSELSSGS
jgi:hypothetical protein